MRLDLTRVGLLVELANHYTKKKKKKKKLRNVAVTVTAFVIAFLGTDTKSLEIWREIMNT